jgi:hypothetical protein
MRKPLSLEMAMFDVLSQEERTEFYRDAIRRAHAARADAVRALFRVFKRRFRRQPLIARAAMSAAATIAIVLALGAILPEPASARVGSVSIGHVAPSHVQVGARVHIDVKPRITPNNEVKKVIYCKVVPDSGYHHKGCTPW